MSSIISIRRAVFLCILASLFVVPEGASAQNRRPRRKKVERSVERPSSGFKVEPYGLEFHESLVGECVELLEDGHVKKAVEKLETAIKEWPQGASLDPVREIKLGLGMILLRSGRTKEARKYLSPLGTMKIGSTVTPRARIMWTICQRMGKPAESAIPLQRPEQWENALHAAAKQRAQELTQDHDKRIKLIDRANWKVLHQKTKSAAQLWEQVYCVRTSDMEREGPPIARGHMETLAHETNLINDYIDAQVRELEMMRGAGMTAGRPRRRGQVQVGAPQINKGKYNRICKAIRDAWKCGNSIVTEYKAVENQQPYGTALGADVRMRVPEFELPRPIK